MGRRPYAKNLTSTRGCDTVGAMTESEARTTAILDSGLFEAWLRPSGGPTPNARARFRWRTHPSNLWLLETQQQRTRLGRVWTSTAHNTVGWTIDFADQLKTFANGLASRPELSDHPRLPVVLAWQKFVWRLPKFAREEAWADNKPYRARDHLAERELLLAEFQAAARKAPPRPLPKNFSLDKLAQKG